MFFVAFTLFLFFSHWSFLVTRRWEGWGRTLVHPSLFWLLVPHLPDQWGLSKATLLDLSAALFRFLCYCSRICTDQRWYRTATLSRITLQFLCQITRDLFSLALHITQICQNPIVEFCAVDFLDLCWWQFWICVGGRRRGRSISGDALSPIRVLS